MSESRKEAVVVLEGEEVGLRFDFNALGMIENETGRPFLKFSTGGGDTDAVEGADEVLELDTRETVRFVHALAHAWSEWHEKPPRSRKRIAGMIGLSDLPALNAVISELRRRNFPDAPPAGEGEGDGEARPTIASVSPSPSSGA